VDMDGGYGNLFNVQRVTELYVNAGVAGAHLEDQVLPKRCGHIAGKALISADEMVGKLRMARAVADDLGRSDFVLIARTDAVSAVDAPEGMRGLDLAIERDEQAYVDIQRREWATGDDIPTKSHHLFTGVPYHQVMGETMGASRLGKFDREIEEKAV